MDQKTTTSSISKYLITRIGLFCLLYFGLMGLSMAPGISDSIDTSFRKRAENMLTKAFPAFQVATVSVQPELEQPNMLTVGYLKKAEIQQQVNAIDKKDTYLTTSFHQALFRIRELFLMPLLIIGLLFLFSPLDWKKKIIGLLSGLLVVYFLLRLKLIGMLQYEIAMTYTEKAPGGLAGLLPYFSSPGLVFLLVVIIWLALFYLLIDKKQIISMLES